MNTMSAVAYEEESSDVGVFVGAPNDQLTLALVAKRTYDTTDGTCVQVPDEDALPLLDDDLPWDDQRELPRVSSVMVGGDKYAFRDATDLVVQGFAHTYGRSTTQTTVSLALRDLRRKIVVHGNRRGEWVGGGPQVGDAAAFDRIALRYENAYGGFDAHALARYGYVGREALRFTRPAWRTDGDTPFHYPRNPAGRGYLVELCRESFEGLELPNLEEPSDPLTPDRLVVASEHAWLAAPQPAAWDWQDPLWFPRCAYLGYARPVDGDAKTCREIERGWAPDDLLEIEPLLQSQAPMRQEFAQGASPGLAIADFRPDETIMLSNVHPRRPRFGVQLPGEVPEVVFQLDGSGKETATPTINSVVLCPEQDRCVVVWSCRIPITAAQQFSEPRYELAWRKGP